MTQSPEAAEARDTLQLKIGGMSCSFCTSTITKAVGRLPGVAEVSVSLAHEEALVRYDPGRATAQEIVDTIRDVGYAVRDPHKVRGVEEQEAELRRELQRFRVSLLVTLTGLGLMVAMWSGHRNPLLPWIVLALAVIQIFFVGRNILGMAIPSVRRRILNQHVLLEFGALGGLLGGILGFFLSTFTVPDFLGAALFITTYHLLSGYASLHLRTRSSQAVQKLMALQPPTARVIRQGGEEEVPIARVVVGDLVRVRPGESLPVDGLVVDGLSTVNEAFVTGEPIPAERGPGTTVIGGSINQAGSLVVRVTKVGEESFLAQVTRYVAEARALKPGIIQVVDRILTIFVPTVLIVGFGALVLWTVLPLAFVGHPEIARGLYAMLAVAVMGYPCALGMATPLAMIRGGGMAAERGILMRSAEAFQTFGHIRRVILDKTGTLTQGRPPVVAIEVAAGVDGDLLLSLAAGAESPSEHPLARAIVEHAIERDVDIPDAREFQSFGGNGVQAVIAGARVTVGKPGFVRQQVEDGTAAIGRALEEQAQTVVLVARDGEMLGAIGIMDAIKPDAREAVDALRRRGMNPMLVTGDNECVGRAVGEQVGITEVHAQVLPARKAELVRELQVQGVRVAMVGDGINDAPALMQADIGIAMGAGTDIAIESADVILVGDRLSAVTDAFDIATSSYRKTKQNLTLALGLNGLGVPAATTGLVNPVWAMVAMVTSVTLVLVNSFGFKRVVPALWSGLLAVVPLSGGHDGGEARPEPAPPTVEPAVVTQRAEERLRLTAHVANVRCTRCMRRIEEELGQLPGVQAVHADLTGSVVVEGNPQWLSVEGVLEELGFPVEERAPAASGQSPGGGGAA